jgi:hypothetical protein
MYVKAQMIPSDTIPGMGGGRGIKESCGRGEFK